MGQNRTFDIKRMHNEYDMLEGCVNRMFITDDQEELPRMRDSAKLRIDRLFELGMERLDKQKEGGK